MELQISATGKPDDQKGGLFLPGEAAGITVHGLTFPRCVCTGKHG